MKTPPYDKYPEWTTARFFGFIRSALRAAYNRYPPKYETLKKAKVGKQVNLVTGRIAEHYKCAECDGLFSLKNVEVDHKIDAGSLKSFEDLPLFVKRLFCSSDDLQVLCKPCHRNKTLKKKL